MKLLTPEQASELGLRIISIFLVALAATIGIGIGVMILGFVSKVYFFLKPFFQ